MRFWRERERGNKEQIVAPLCGQVRVLVVGDSGVGKSSLVHLIVKGSSSVRPSQTIGCTVGVKHLAYGSPASSSSSIKSDSGRDFFVELWDVSGVIFVHDLSQRRTKTNLQKWAAEVSAAGTFSAPLSYAGPGGLPVPYIVIGNKADIAAKEGTHGSSGNLVDAARQWVEKQGLLPHSDELPLSESFTSSGGLIMAAKEARYDKEALNKFFSMLIRRRYFSDELPSSSSAWSLSPAASQVLDEGTSDEDQFYKRTRTNMRRRIESKGKWKQHFVTITQYIGERLTPSKLQQYMELMKLFRSRQIEGDELISALLVLFKDDEDLSEMFNKLMETEIRELEKNETREPMAASGKINNPNNVNEVEEGETQGESHCHCGLRLPCEIGRDERDKPIKKRSMYRLEPTEPALGSRKFKSMINKSWG